MRLTKLLSGLSALVFIACGSSGGGGGAASCADGGVCPQGQVCGQNGLCVPTGTGGFGNSGGFGNNGGTGGGSSAICQQYCSFQATANCPSDPGVAACTTACETARQSTPQCIAELDAYLACALTGQATCGPDGTPTVNTNGACDGQSQVLSSCMSVGTGGGVVGGSGGTGGGVLGGFGGTGATGGFGGTTGGFGGTGATGGFGGTTGGFGGTGATGGSGGTTNACNPAYYGSTCSQLSTGVPTCDTCAKANCCSSIDTCLQDQTCAEAIYCFLNFCATSSDPITCLTTTCSACASAPAAFPVLSCLQSYCVGQCPGI